jgi:hypothetical protein
MHNKEFIVKVLKRLKDNQAIHNTFYDLGLDATVFFDKTGYINLLEESIATMLSGDDQEIFEGVLWQIQWWLYEDVDKVITINPNHHINVDNAEDFIIWLSELFNIK